MRAVGPVALTLLALVAANAGQAALEETPAYRVLLIGNSHSSSSGLPKLLRTMLEAADPRADVRTKALGRWNFLADRLDDNYTQKALESDPWTHVVLQAQKYSTSGRYHYPTDAAEGWIRRVRERQAVPILFPEWARRGVTGEAERVHALHMEIAEREPACVAPVGYAWMLALESDPSLRLHARDGNHANRKGALLTAYVLYEAIAGNPAAELPFTKKLKEDEETQGALRAAASKAFREIPGCPLSLRQAEPD